MLELRESGEAEITDESEHLPETDKAKPLKPFVSDFLIDTDLEIMFPDEFVSNIPERIRLYKELNEIGTEDELSNFEKKLKDRFGIIPQPAMDLLDIVRIKWIAVKLGMEKIVLKNNLLIASFISDQNSQFYRSALFVSIMNYVNRKQRQMNMKQKESKLSLTVSDVKSVKSAIRVLNEIVESN
jgi:transcription-repair coupling factor (superfamily II helicase)